MFAVSIASCIISGLLLVVTTVSVICAFRSYNHQRLRAKIQTSCDLAKYYADEVIEKYSFIATVMRRTKIDEYVYSVFDINEIKNFDYKEMESQLKKLNISVKDVEEKITKPDPFAILYAKMNGSKNALNRSMTWSSYVKADEESGEKKICNDIYLQGEFEEMITSTLNSLEWFAMCCQHGVADEEVLYQSLHVTFISLCWLLYYRICAANEKSEEDKLYTNLIWLFNTWKQRLEDIRTELEQKKTAANEALECARRDVESVSAVPFVGKKLK